MKALLISMGTRGDVEPFLAVGEILGERGWEVVCLFPEQFRGMTEAMGFRFHGFSEEFLKLIEGSDAKEILGGEGGAFSRVRNWATLARSGMKLAAESVEVQHRIQLDEAPDRIIYHPKCNTAIVWGMANPGKAIQLAPIPGLVHAVDEFAPMWKDFGRSINRASYRLINWFKAFAVKKFTKQFTTDLGFKKLTVAEINRALLETEKTIYTVSPSLFDRPAYWPETARVVGYFERDKAVGWQPDERLLEFLKAHDKIVFISFGSMTNTKPLEKTRAIVNVLKRNNIPAIINTSWGGLCEIDDAPEHVLFVNDVPYDWLYPHIYAVVHHGGSGSTHMALKYGCPSLVVPHALDQPFWARIVHEKGAGPAGLAISKLTELDFEQKLLDLYDNLDHGTNAERIGLAMSSEADAGKLYQIIVGDIERS
ncbi:MAG: glycosyltransferase family 1 protein [Acidobacteriota bacterium]|nr:MAG: glycosyltransferase family 1 protein [Acidobacteriota bacterium]